MVEPNEPLGMESLKDLVARERQRIETILSGPSWTCPQCGVPYHFPEGREPRCWTCDQATAALAERMERLRIPPRFASLEIEAPELRRWIAGVVDGTETDGILLSGSTGVHKSGNAFAGLVMAIEAGYAKTVLWANVGDLFDGASFDEQRARMHALSTCGLALLDDLGASVDSERLATGACRILDARWRQQLPTIVTTNLDPHGTGPGSVTRALGDRVASRLSSYLLVRMVGEDDRKRATLSSEVAPAPRERPGA